MTYRDQLYPWCIIRLLPDNKTTVVARFRHRMDAEAHLQLLNQLTPSADYRVVFEPTARDDSPEDGPEEGEDTAELDDEADRANDDEAE
jgi:hypothetical protein